MDQYTYHDTPTDEEMMDWLGGLHGGEIIINPLGQPITMPSDYRWRHDLVWVDQQLKAMANARHILNHQRLIQPEVFGAETVVLAQDPLLEMLTAVFTVLVTMFEKTDSIIDPAPTLPVFYGLSVSADICTRQDFVSRQH
jgi:hypothetical protein